MLPNPTSLDRRRAARTFVAGAAVGAVAGALVVCGIVWRYGNVVGSRAAGIRYPADPPSALERWQDGSGAERAETNGGGAAPGRARSTIEGAATGTTGPDVAIGPPPESPHELRARGLEIPVEGVEPEQLTRSFHDERGGARRHEAIDILAPRNTPVIAVEDGVIARLLFSDAGGLTIYQFDVTERYCYYYAHLERYADSLREGARVRKGQVIGYVGTSGNAPPGTPHLHFAVYKLTAEKRWSEGIPIDPYDVLR